VSYLEACAEFGSGLRARLDLESLAVPTAFELYCRALAKGRLEWQHTHAGDWMRVLWWCEGDTYLGESTIRPDLTPAYGSYPSPGQPARLVGHIGYDIRPSMRGRGQGRALLQATLREAARLGIDPVVLAVEAGNAASIRVIESCGGHRYRRPDEGVVLYLASGRDLP
jgi:RimJ/RimL family protein N-acetyltransferase